MHIGMNIDGVVSAGSRQEPQPLLRPELVTFSGCRSRVGVRPLSRAGVGFLFTGQFEWGL